MKFDPQKAAPADLRQAAAKTLSAAVQRAVKPLEAKPAPATPQAPADAVDVPNGLQKMRAIKRGGTGQLPWEAINALATATADVKPRDPNAILQAEGKQTCAAANKQMAMADRNPLQYNRLARELALKGEAKLPNGEAIALSDANRRFVDNMPGLTDQGRVNLKFQAALMDYANGEASYDMETDLSMNADGSVQVGLTATQTKALDALDSSTETATPEAIRADAKQQMNVFMRLVTALCEQFGFNGPGFTTAVSEALRAELGRAQGERRELVLAIGIDDGKTDAHMITVTGIDDKGRVSVKDTYGEFTYSAKEFAEALPKSDNAGVGEGTTTASTSGSAGNGRPPRR